VLPVVKHENGWAFLELIQAMVYLLLPVLHCNLKKDGGGSIKNESIAEDLSSLRKINMVGDVNII